MSLSKLARHTCTLFISGFLLSAAPLHAQPLDKPSLFEEAMIFGQPEINGNALRSRSVIITDSAFTGGGQLLARSDSTQSEEQTAPVQSIQLNLFEDVVVDVNLTNAYQNNSGSQTWIGKIESDTIQGTAVFVIRDGQVYGSVEVPGKGTYSVRPGEFNSHIVEQVDGTKLLNGETDAVIPEANFQARSDNATEASTAGATVELSNDNGSIIDVYVGAHQSIDQTAAQSMAELFIAYTNQAYENSGINQRVWLAGNVDSYNYTTVSDTNPVVSDRLTDEAVDLNAAKNGGIVGLHDARDDNHADLVMFLRPFDATKTVCAGLGFIQESVNDLSFESSAFSVMEGCTFGNTVFAHELGHNMGSRHDWYVNTGDKVTPKTFAAGYIDLANKFSTIMSYNNRCIAEGTTCPRIAHFSNPDVNHNGFVTGVAAGTSTNCPAGVANPAQECDADNARNFNESAPITSQFRSSRVVWTGNVSTNWGDAGNWTAQRGVSTTVNPVSFVPRSFDNVLIPASLANYPVITGTANARELTIVEGATVNMSGGTLTVGWAWEDAGGFTATGGTVKLIGPIGVTVTSGEGSQFNNIEVGSGSDTTKVTLDTDVAVNGNFTISAGASLVSGVSQVGLNVKGNFDVNNNASFVSGANEIDLDVDGNFTINVGGEFKSGASDLKIAGNFDDKGRGFKPGSGNVIFDGVAQTVDKTTDQALLDETFSRAVGESLSTTFLPTDWGREGSVFGGDLAAFGLLNSNGMAFTDPGNTWLLTKAVTLSANTRYTLQFEYRKPNEIQNPGAIESVTAMLGTTQASSSMNTEITKVTGDASFSGNFQVKQESFTVSTDGTYYIGFNVIGTASTILDNVKLDGVSLLQFNNLTVASGETDILKVSEIAGNLIVNAGATADLGANSTSVEGTVTNNGEIKQTQTASAGINTAFVSIKDKEGSTDKYFGLEINPTTSLGSTIVSVKGSQTCPSMTDFVNRCYTITPTTPGTSVVKFYHLETELNGNTQPFIKSISGGAATAVSTPNTRGGSGDSSFVSGAALMASGVFGLEDASDTVPDAFSFTDASALANTILTSDSITVTGINADSPISITGGTYSINGGAYISTESTVANGDTVTVRNTTDATTGATVDTVLTIGTISDTYTITTDAPDITPDSFVFIDVTNASISTVQTSAAITINGINAAASIAVTGGSYSIDGGAYTTTAGTVENGSTVTVQHTSSPAFSTSVNTTLTVGGSVTETYTSTTEAADAIPDTFTFIDVDSALVNSLATSNVIIIAGINSPASITITGGSYKINNGAYTTVAGTVDNNDTVTVQNTAPATLGSSTDTVVTIGGISDTFTSTTAPADTIPQGFTFTDVTGVALSTIQTSSAITVSGINSPSTISVTGGEYSIDGAAYTNVAGTINNGQAVTVQHTSSANVSSMANTVLTIGGVDDTFTSTTEAADTAPDAFEFTDVTGVALGSLQTSNSFTVAGINTAAAISVTSGSYKIGAGSYTTVAGTVNNGDVVTVQHTASSNPGAVIDTVLTIGGVSDTYSSTTIDIVPDVFTFIDVDNVLVNSVSTSNTITIAGITSSSPITITGGSYKINNGTYTTTAGTVDNGDTVTVQNTASDTLGTSVDTVLTIGGISDTFTVTTAPVDTTPESFTFTDVTEVVLNSTQTSNAITVDGVNSPSAISVTGGSYSIDSGAYTNVDGIINNGQTVTVQHTASGSLGTSVDTVLTIGGVSDTYSSTTVAPDTTPEAFSFTDVTGVNLGSLQTSSSITVNGINTTTEISVLGGSYKIGTGSYTTVTGTVNDGDVVTVQHTASGAPGAATDTVLTIGGVSDTYTSTTVGPDTTPSAFTFIDVTEVALSSEQISNTITVADINTAAAISVTGGLYKINSGDYTATGGTVNSGDTVTVKHTASGILGTAVDTVLTIGGVSDTYTSTTEVPDTAPDAFAFTDVSDVALSSTQTSNTVTVSGINTAAAISVTGGAYSLNGGAFTTAAGTINNGDNVVVQQTSSATPLTGVDTVLTIGGVSDTYTSISEAPDTAPDQFAFVDATNTGGVVQTSASVTVSGINISAPISVTGAGSYSINGGDFTTTDGTVNNGDKVAVKHELGANDDDTVDTVINIGGVIDTFTSTTVAADTITPTGVAPEITPTAATVPAGEPVISPSITVAGLTADKAPITVTNGEYRITPFGTARRGGVFTSEPGYVQNGDVVEMRHLAATTAGVTTTTTLTLGTVETTFVSKSTSTITGTASSGGGSISPIGLLFLSMFTLLFIARRRKLGVQC